MNKLRFSPKQKKVLTFWCGEGGERYDAVICDGAVRSGKTLCMSLSFVLWACRNFNNQQFALCGKSVAALRRNVIRDLLQRLRRLGFSCTEHKSEGCIEIGTGRRMNYFYLFGGYDESSADRIQGITLAGVLLDEVVLMPRSFVEQACARCSVSGSKLWFNCNPESPRHWFYREWICRAEERKALYLHFTMEDNPSLSRKIRQRYERTFSGVFYQRFVLGKWTAAEGRIYDFFTREMAKPVPEGEREKYVLSVDYGTANPASFGLWGLQQGVWYREAEYYYDSRREGRQKTDGEYVKDLKTFLQGRSVETVLADPSAASFITALRREGFSVQKADNAVAEGIRVTAELLRQGKLVICDTCSDCLRELELYAWEEGRDAPKKVNDHAMDEMRYFALYLSRQGRKSYPVAGFVERRV